MSRDILLSVTYTIVVPCANSIDIYNTEFTHYTLFITMSLATLQEGKARNYTLVVPTEEFDASVLQSHHDFKFMVHRREISEEGFDHTHVVVSFENPVRVAALNKLLPNIITLQTVKKLESILEYIQKDDDTACGAPTTIGVIPKRIQDKIDNKTHSGISMVKSALLKRTYAEAIQECEQVNVWEYVKNKKSIENYLATKFIPKLNIQPITNFNKEVVNMITFKGRQQAVLLVGPSGIGKTQLALSYFGNPLIITCKQDFGKLTPDHGGMVIDDLPWSNHAAETLLRLVNTEIPQTIDIKYGTAFIPIGTKKIFTLNTEKQFWPKEIEENPEVYNAIKSRIKIINIHNNIFIDNKEYVSL